LHDEVNDRPGPGLEMRGAGLQVEGGAASCRGRSFGGRQAGAAVKVLAEQVGQGGAVSPVGDALEKAAPAQGQAANFLLVALARNRRLGFNRQ
jgi:hypothetical protein